MIRGVNSGHVDFENQGTVKGKVTLDETVRGLID